MSDLSVLYAVAEVGESKVRFALIRDHKILAYLQLAAPPSHSQLPAAFIQGFRTWIEASLDTESLDMASLNGVAVTVTAPVDFDAGIVYEPSMWGGRETILINIIKETFSDLCMSVSRLLYLAGITPMCLACGLAVTMGNLPRSSAAPRSLTKCASSRQFFLT